MPPLRWYASANAILFWVLATFLMPSSQAFHNAGPMRFHELFGTKSHGSMVCRRRFTPVYMQESTEEKSQSPPAATAAVNEYTKNQTSMQQRLFKTVTLSQGQGSVLGELTTDDGIPVSELTDTTRPDWVQELLTTFDSRVLDRISDRMTLTVAWASYISVIVWWTNTLAPDQWSNLMQLAIPGWPHELVGGFLSILLVFRTDQAYDRFWEGRRRWSSIYSQCRDLARLTLSNLDGPIADHFMAHIAAYPVALKQHLRGQKNTAEIAAVFNTYLAPNNTVIKLVTDSNNMPLTVLMSLSQVAAPLRYAPRYTNLDVLWQQFEDHIQSLTEVVSDCEKIKCTPLPLSYSRHASRFFSVFTLTLPFALVKETSPLLVAPIVAFISWVLFVTDEIGHVIEDPFGNGLVRDPDDVARNAMTDEDIKIVFQRMDRDGTGKIELSDLEKSLEEIAGIDMKSKKAEEVMARLDLNGDGFIDFEEFRQSWTVTAGKRNEIKQLETLPLGQYCDGIQAELLYHWRVKQLRWQSEEFQYTKQTVVNEIADVATQFEGVRDDEDMGLSVEMQKKIFQKLDMDGSGDVSAAELRAGLSNEYSPEESQALFEELDLNEDGVIDWKEFQLAWTVSDVLDWLQSVGLAEYKSAFRRNDVDGKVLAELSNDDLMAMGIESVGKRIAILEQVNALPRNAQQFEKAVGGSVKDGAGSGGDVED